VQRAASADIERGAPRSGNRSASDHLRFPIQ
jgi:hypothetical protein